MEDDIPTQHEALADRISEIIENVSDWDAPTPVAEWRARDVVEHLISWPPAMLGGMPNTKMATASALIRPRMAAQCAAT